MRLRICAIAEDFPPDGAGLAPAIFDLSQEQHRRGHDLVVIARRSGAAQGFDRNLPFRVIRLPGERQLTFGWHALRAIRDMMPKPDIIHTHGGAALPYLFASCRKPPAVATVHSIRRAQYPLLYDLGSMIEPVREILGADKLPRFRRYSPTSPGVLREYMMERLICRRARHLALVAEHMVPVVRRLFGVQPDRCSAVYNGTSLGNGVSSPTGADESLAMIGCDAAAEVILFVGRPSWLKRVHLPLMSLPLLLRHRPRAVFVCVGGGPLEKVLRLLAKQLGVSRAVRFMPWIPHEKVQDMYRIARCFCLPSISEGMPKAVLDAMAMGVPVVASDIPGHRELLEGGRLGTLVPEPEPEAWSCALESALSAPAAAEKAALARARVDERYRWSHVAARLDAIYESVLEETR